MRTKLQSFGLVTKFFSFVVFSTSVFIFSSNFLHGDTQFPVRRMTRNDVPFGKGQCDIRLRVDGEAEVTVTQDRVHVRTISGRDARDAGSECNEPFPIRSGQEFNFERFDGRGEMQLLGSYDRRRRSAPVVRIRDNQNGEGRYHFRLSWNDNGQYTRQGNSGVYGPYEDRGGYGDYRSYPNDRRSQSPPYGRTTVSGGAIRSCEQAVRSRIERDYRFPSAEIFNTRVDDRPGRNDTVLGQALGRRGRDSQQFNFSCSVNVANANVRNVEIWRR